MDVVKMTTLGALSLLLILGCDQRESGPASPQLIKSGDEDCEGQRVQGQFLVSWKNGDVSVEEAPDDETFIQEFLAEHEEEVLVAEPHYRMSLEPEVEESGWGGGVNWGVFATHADQAWGKSLPGKPVVVAVIDSGFDPSHPELHGQLAINELEEINEIDDDNNGYVDDRYGYDFANDSYMMTDSTGHGTHVSGVIAARHDVGSVLGVAPFVKILPLKFIGENGGGMVMDAVRAIRYAKQQKAQIINASWGGEACSLLLRDEMAEVAKDNILFVVAAGNRGRNLSRNPEYPAAFLLDNMITVGASTYDHRTAGFSNYGLPVDLVAPGANISSTIPYEFDMDGKLDGVMALNGTSMAAPFVAGAAALLWQERPNASFVEIKKALLDSVKPGPFPVATRGQLDISKALQIFSEATLGASDNTPLK